MWLHGELQSWKFSYLNVKSEETSNNIQGPNLTARHANDTVALTSQYCLWRVTNCRVVVNRKLTVELLTDFHNFVPSYVYLFSLRARLTSILIVYEKEEPGHVFSNLQRSVTRKKNCHFMTSWKARKTCHIKVQGPKVFSDWQKEVSFVKTELTTLNSNF